MSETIEARFYNDARTTLLQRRPGAIIDVSESLHPAAPMQFYGGGEGLVINAGAYRKGTKLAGATRAVLIVDTHWFAATAGIPTAQVEDFKTGSWMRWSEISKALFLKATVEAKAGPSAAARVRVERLAAIQAILGFSTSDFARALGLSRAGLYKWLDVTSNVKLQEASRERLAAIERISKQWRERSTAPLSSVADHPLADGRTVLSLLLADQVDETAIVGEYDQLLGKLAGMPKSRSQKLADAGFRRRPSARSLPSDD